MKEQTNINNFISAIRTELATDKPNKKAVEKLAAEYGINRLSEIKELSELAIVLEARKIAENSVLSSYEKYNEIVALYKKQFILSLRTSLSMILQQYSTPAPISYLASLYVAANNNSAADMFFEPSAGNGLLTIALPYKQTIVNEIDEIRHDNLQRQPFAKVTKTDATLPFVDYYKKFAGIVTNPPFGKLDNEVEFEGFPIKNLEHLMALRALDTMKDAGKAAIIIGGHTNWDEKGRIQAGKNRIFLNYLYSRYNVADVILIDGSLYSRQGTSFDIRLILIDGRKPKPEGFAPLKDNILYKVVDNYDELYDRVFGIRGDLNKEIWEYSSKEYLAKQKAKNYNQQNSALSDWSFAVRNAYAEGKKVPEANLKELSPAELEWAIKKQDESKKATAKENTDMSKEINQPFHPIDNNFVDSFLETKILKPKRGMYYNKAETSDIKTFASQLDNLTFNMNNDIANHWRTIILQWHDKIKSTFGKEKFVLFFVHRNSTNANTYGTIAYIPEHDFYSWHPINQMSPRIYLNENKGISCKYGDCFFNNPKNWTRNNVIESLKNCIIAYDEFLVSFLNILSDSSIYESKTVYQWIKATTKYDFSNHFKAHVLKKVYSIDCDYNSVDNVIKALLLNNPSANEEKALQLEIEVALAMIKISKIKIAIAKAKASELKGLGNIADQQVQIQKIIDAAIENKGSKAWEDLGYLSEEEILLIKDKFEMDLTGYKRVITVDDVNHAIKRHGNIKVDSYPIDYADLLLIPHIVNNCDDLIQGEETNQTNLKTLIWIKEIGDKYYFVEEVRTGRSKLALKTFYKKPLKT